MNLKLYEKYFVRHENKKTDFLYECPHCGSDVYEKDPLIIVDGYAYCLECERPMLPECKSFNTTLAKRTPSNDELIEILSMEEFE